VAGVSGVLKRISTEDFDSRYLWWNWILWKIQPR